MPSPINDNIEQLHLRIKELENREHELLKVLRVQEALHLKILNALPLNIFLEDREGRTIFLNLKVVAEGIETEKQLHFFKERECDFGQGYLISRPVDMSQQSNWLKTPYTF